MPKKLFERLPRPKEIHSGRRARGRSRTAGISLGLERRLYGGARIAHRDGDRQLPGWWVFPACGSYSGNWTV